MPLAVHAKCRSRAHGWGRSNCLAVKGRHLLAENLSMVPESRSDGFRHWHWLAAGFLLLVPIGFWIGPSAEQQAVCDISRRCGSVNVLSAVSLLLMGLGLVGAVTRVALGRRCATKAAATKVSPTPS